MSDVRDGVDLLDPALHARDDVWDELARLRALDPVSWRQGRRGPGYWAVLGHAELAAAARDTETFSSWWGTRPEVIRPDGALRPLHNLDPPQHGRLRAIAGRSVDADQLARIAPIAQQTIARTFATIVDAKSGDAVAGLAEPIAAQVFAQWLGTDDAATVLLDTVTAVHTAGALLLDCAADASDRAERVAAAAAASRAMGELITRGLRDARAPSVLALLRDADLPQNETIALGALLVEAGLPTMIDAITATLAVVVPRLDRLRETIDEPRRRTLLIEESLRLASPIAQFARRARRDTTLGAHRIMAGQQVVLWFGAANRDPRVFARPDELIADRAPNPHFAFGVGPHRCLGASMTRAILAALLTELASHTGCIQLAPGARRRASSYQRGYALLPMLIERG